MASPPPVIQLPGVIINDSDHKHRLPKWVAPTVICISLLAVVIVRVAVRSILKMCAPPGQAPAAVAEAQPAPRVQLPELELSQHPTSDEESQFEAAGPIYPR